MCSMLSDDLHSLAIMYCIETELRVVHLEGEHGQIISGEERKYFVILESLRYERFAVLHPLILYGLLPST